MGGEPEQPAVGPGRGGALPQLSQERERRGAPGLLVSTGVYLLQLVS